MEPYLAGLKDTREIIIRKINMLRNSLVLEQDAIVKFKYEEILHESESQLERIDASIHEIISKDDQVKEEHSLGVLFLAANPDSSSRLRLDKEYNAILDCFSNVNKNKFLLNMGFVISPKRLIQLMLDNQPNILHFSGHGSSDGIYLEDENGVPILAKGDQLKNLFQIFSEKLDCVLLNSCFSIKQAQIISKSIHYVIGMSSSISDKAAINFSCGFYSGVVSGKNIKDSFELGKTMVSMHNEDESSIPVILINRGGYSDK